MPIVKNEEELTDENLRRILSYSLAIDYNIEIDGEFIKDEADKKIKTEPLFFEDRVCSNNYTFVLNIADGNVILTASVNTPDFIRGAEGGEDARKRATQLLKRALTAKGVKIIENHNDSVIYFSREQLKKNDFLKTTTMGKVDIFLDKIKTDPEAREKLAKDILAIANNLDFHIDQSKDIKKIRAHRKKQFEEGDGKEGYEKSVYTYPKRGDEEGGYPEGLIKRKRVKISDSPFWVSIYVVNGEFVIATQEDHIYLGGTSQQMVDLKEALEKNIDFKKVFDAAKKKGSDMVYVGNRMYFTQNAFNELKKNKEAAIKKVDEPLITAAKPQSIIKKEVLSANNLCTYTELLYNLRAKSSVVTDGPLALCLQNIREEVDVLTSALKANPSELQAFYNSQLFLDNIEYLKDLKRVTESVLDGDDKHKHIADRCVLAYKTIHVAVRKKSPPSAEEIVEFGNAAKEVIAFKKENPNKLKHRGFLTTMALVGGPKEFLQPLYDAQEDFAQIDNFGAHPAVDGAVIFPNTPLIWAIANAHNKFAEDILDFASKKEINIGIDVVSLGNTALMLAAAKGYTNISYHGEAITVSNLTLVQKIVTLKADPNIKNRTGHTALDIAVARRNLEMVRAICESPKINQDTLYKAIQTLGFNFERYKEIISNVASGISLPLQQEDFDSHDNDIVQSIRQAIESKLPAISQKYSKGIEVEARESITNQEETKSNKLIVDRFIFYKTKAELKAASRVLGKIPHTIITAEDLQFLPCEDSEKYKMTARNVDDVGDWKANTLPSSPKETYVKLGGNFAEQLQPQTKNPSKAFQPYGAKFEWMRFREIEGGKRIFGTAYLLNAKFNNCVFDGVDFSKIPEEALKTISFNDCVFTNNCKPEGIEKRNKDMKAEVEDVKKIVNAITGDTWDKARNNWKAVIEARKKEDPKPKVSLAKYESVGAGLTNLVAKLNEIRSTHKTR